MSSFSYTAIDRQGRRTSGTVPADSRAAAMDDIARPRPVAPHRHRGRWQGRPNKSSAPAPKSFTFSLGNPNKVPQKAVESFTRELANLLAAGLSLSRSLALLAA